MEPDTQDKLKDAIIRYAKGLDMEALIDYVTVDLWGYYTGSADEEEALAFIQEMEGE